MSKNTKPELEVTELSEDMEMIGPGSMLSEAREKLSLTQEQIAQRLNFKVSVVENIENDNFDQSLPATYNRGYLCSYAKIVGIATEDVLASYDALGAANIQRSEMQSFSKETVKQAEHSRLMWISYCIVAILLGLTVMWWLQESRQQAEVVAPVLSTSVADENTQKVTPDNGQDVKSVNVDNSVSAVETKEQGLANELVDAKANIKAPLSEKNAHAEPHSAAQHADTVDATNIKSLEKIQVPVNQETTELTTEIAPEKAADLTQIISKAVFTFSGDCWVNIYDDTGERVAWGVKKSGYVMSISGQAPFKVTLGKPELASIVFNDEEVDLSSLNVGNIAKFSLPLTSQ